MKCMEERPASSLLGVDALAIVNPRSASGRTAAMFKSLLPQLPNGIDISYTKWSGHAVELARNAVEAGKQMIVAVGGDGTINKVVNGMFDEGGTIDPNVVLAVIPSGTGSDFQRSLGIPSDPAKAAGLLRFGATRLIDVMRVRYTTMAGAAAVRYSVNVTSFGLGGAVANRANRTSKALGGRLSFLLATLTSALRFFGNKVVLQSDGRHVFSGRITNVAAGNGQYHGGGMQVCPGALLDDGLIDVTTVGYLNLFELIRELPRLYNGTIGGCEKVQSFQTRLLGATSFENSAIEIDGEPLGRLPIEISILPRALRVVTA